MISSDQPKALPSTGAGPLLEVAHLTKHYAVRGGVFGRARAEVHAVDDVSLTIGEGSGTSTNEITSHGARNWM